MSEVRLRSAKRELEATFRPARSLVLNLVNVGYRYHGGNQYVKDTSAATADTITRKWKSASHREVDVLARCLATCAVAPDVGTMQNFALEAIADAWHYRTSTFLLADASGTDINMSGGVVRGLPPESLRTYLASYAFGDVFLGGRAQTLLADRGIVDLRELGPARTSEEKQYVDRFMEPLGIRSQLSTRVDTGLPIRAFLSIMSSEREAFDSRDRSILQSMAAIVGPYLSALLLRAKEVSPERFELSPRERDVAMLAASGFDNATIARRLSIEIDTVKKHLVSAFRKAGIRNRTQLALRIRERSDT